MGYYFDYYNDLYILIFTATDIAFS